MWLIIWLKIVGLIPGTCLALCVNFNLLYNFSTVYTLAQSTSLATTPESIAQISHSPKRSDQSTKSAQVIYSQIYSVYTLLKHAIKAHNVTPEVACHTQW